MYEGLLTTVVTFSGHLVRNIKGIRESQNLFDDLGDDELDMAVAQAAESQGKVKSRAPLITRPFDYGTVITYPFLPQNWQETRFSDGLSYGVWYGSREMETTVHETVYHWRRFVTDSFSDLDREITADRRVFQVTCQGILVDLRGKEQQFPGLVSRDSYGFTQPLGAYLHEQRQNGLLTPSARCNGINSPIFNPAILSTPVDICFLAYRWNPAKGGEVTVERSGRGRRNPVGRF